MSEFQLLTGYVNLGGERNNVAYRGPDNPITYPESLLLQVIHGGQEHVHTLVEIGTVERSNDEEFMRLSEKYGGVAKAAFPPVGGRVSLPARDDALPTAEAVAAAKAASEEAMAAVMAGAPVEATPEPAPAPAPAPAPTPAPTPEPKTEASTPAAKPAAKAKAKPAAAVPSLDDLPK